MSNLKKVLALVLVLALSLTMFAGAIETVLPYDDVDELTAEQLDSLKLLYALGVIKGDDENSVNPTDTLTRGELCAILYRLYTGDAEEKYVSTYSADCPYFDDVEAGKWYVPYVNWAYIKGVVAGYGNGKFGPTDNVTGVQAATMLSRLVGYEIGSENWELVSRKHAIELGLDDGVASKDLFGTDLSRGDMIVMVANVLDCYEVGTKVTLAEKIFDLEIIRGAILLGADKLGSTDYSVFAFKDEISGNVKYFITDLLSIEEKPTVDEIGQKYTLYVAKTTEVNGYKVLYAAYEEDENAYYKTVTGVIDDGKLNTTDASEKDTYLLNLLDDHCILYINGAVAANNAADAFNAFKASYGLKNSAAYKLIDNDGDGKYEYIFIQRLTLAAMNTTEVVANVVSYNNITGAYTLSDGKEYVPGQYWGVDKDNKITNSVINAVDAIVAAIGKDGYTASSVQYKFTIENGKYIMKAEICDETYFAGDYVLAMNSVGDSTYKGMRYVEFLTEDNTTLYAYVSKINHNDVRIWNGANDNGKTNAYNYQLYYINAYGDDTVELFTPEYINSNYVNDVYKRDPQILVPTGTSAIVLNAVPDVYTQIKLVAGKDEGALIPELAFDATKYYALKGEDGKLNPVFFTQTTYTGHFAKLAAGIKADDTVAAAEKQAVEDAKTELTAAQGALDTASTALDTAKTDLGTAKTDLDEAKAALTTKKAALEADAEIWDGTAGTLTFDDDGGFTAATGTLVADAADKTTATEYKAAFDAQKTAEEAVKTAEEAVKTAEEAVKTAEEAVKAAEEKVAKAEKALADAQAAALAAVSDVYYISAPARDQIVMNIGIQAAYDTNDMQIYKAYGTWYVQSYGDVDSSEIASIVFILEKNSYAVTYDETKKNFYYTVGDEKKIFSVGEADAEAIKESIDEVINDITTNGTWNAYGSENMTPDYIWNTATALNTSKGVVFAYGQYPVDGRYVWRAYNFDEFNRTFFGKGGKDDDNARLNLDDQMIYMVSNGQFYVKAAKVTVAAVGEHEEAPYQYDLLPMGWMVENSMVFVYGNQKGTITTEGETVQAVLPNGTTKNVFIPYGMLNTYVPNGVRYGNVYYAVLSENGDVISVEYICNIYDVFDGTTGGKLTQLSMDKYLGYAADGTVTLQGKLGLTYTAKIDLTKTFFMVDTSKTFVSSEDFAKYLANTPNATFTILVDAYGYNYAIAK